MLNINDLKIGDRLYYTYGFCDANYHDLDCKIINIDISRSAIEVFWGRNSCSTGYWGISNFERHP